MSSSGSAIMLAHLGRLDVECSVTGIRESGSILSGNRGGHFCNSLTCTQVFEAYSILS